VPIGLRAIGQLLRRHARVAMRPVHTHSSEMSMLDDLITRRPPPPNRMKGCDGNMECHLSEGAVMVAFAMHLLRTVPSLAQVSIHPDGEHAKIFDFEGWLQRRGFSKKSLLGKTTFGGTYASSTGQTIVVNPSSGRGDVSAEIDGSSIYKRKEQNHYARARHGVLLGT
jgi:hypothetical protein